MFPELVSIAMCFVCLKKNEEDELVWAGEHTYHMARCQKRVFPTPFLKVYVTIQMRFMHGIGLQPV